MGTRRIKRRGRGRTRLDPEVHTQNPPAVRVNRDLAAEALAAQKKRKEESDSEEEPETPRKTSTAAPSEPEDEETPLQKLRKRKTSTLPVVKGTLGQKTRQTWYGVQKHNGNVGGRKTRRRKHNRRRR